MKRKPPAPKGTRVGSQRWPGAGNAGLRKAIMTNRNKKIKVSLVVLKDNTVQRDE